MISEPVTSVEPNELSNRLAPLKLGYWILDRSFSVIGCSHVCGGAGRGDKTVSTAIAEAAAACFKSGRVDSFTTADEEELFCLPLGNQVVVVDLCDAAARMWDRETLVAVLTHFHADLTKAAQSDLAIDGYNAQLSQSYEEVNLIFQISKLLTGNYEPCKAVATMCDELRAVLGYGWVAVVFEQAGPLLADLQGTTVISGELGFDETQLRLSSLFIPKQSVVKVLEPAHCKLAQQLGSEILSKRITHGGANIGLFLAGNRQGVDPDVSSNELQLVDATVGFLELFHENAFRFAQQRKQFMGTLHALTSAVDAKDPYTRGHSERVGMLGAQLAAALGYSPADVEATRIAGLLHDIGKIGVPDSILTKPARLTDEEFEKIKIHPTLGHQILSQLPTLEYQLPGVLHHHEKWDGSGYPHRLSGETIPMLGRLLALADTFDAMSSNRAYRPAMPREKVLAEIQRSAGSQFDPALVPIFIRLDFSEFDRLIREDQAAHAVSMAA